MQQATGSAKDDDLLAAVRVEIRAGLGARVKFGSFDEQEVPVLELPSAHVSELSRRVASVINEWCSSRS